MVCLEDLKIEDVFNLIKNNLMALESFEDWVLDRESTAFFNEKQNSYKDGYDNGYRDCLDERYER